MSVYGAVLSPATAAVERLGWVLMHSLWQFAALGAFAAVVLRLLRHWSSAARHGFLVLVLGLTVTAPLATWLLQPPGQPPVRVPIDAPGITAVALVPGKSDPGSPALESPTEIESLPPSALTTSEVSFRVRVRSALEPCLPWAVWAWCVGVALCSVRPLIGWRTLRRLRTVGLSAPPDNVLEAFDRAYRRLGIRRAVRVSCSTLAEVPLVAGYLRPAVLLPVGLIAGIPASQLEAVGSPGTELEFAL